MEIGLVTSFSSANVLTVILSCYTNVARYKKPLSFPRQGFFCCPDLYTLIYSYINNGVSHEHKEVGSNYGAAGHI
jgi:hypothetical protein